MSLKEEYELLRRVPYFAEIEPAKLKLLAFMSERVAFDPGKPLFRQGDAGDAAYLIISGEAEVLRETPSGPVLLATIGVNEFVGDMAILGAEQVHITCARGAQPPSCSPSPYYATPSSA